MTARQIASKMGFNDLNMVRPRLTELRDSGVIETVGKAYDTTSKRHVALFRKVM